MQEWENRIVDPVLPFLLFFRSLYRVGPCKVPFPQQTFSCSPATCPITVKTDTRFRLPAFVLSI